MFFRLSLLAIVAAAVAPAADFCVLPAGTVLRVTLDRNSPRSIKPAIPVTGVLRQPVYHGTCRVLPSGVAVRATGNRVELAAPGQATVGAMSSVVRYAAERHAVAAGKPGSSARVLLLRLDEPLTSRGTELPTADGGTIAAGVQARVALESAVGSKKSRAGDAVRARLIEPVLVDGKVLLPPGTVVHGTLAVAKKARRAYRAGALRIAFQSLEIASNRQVSVPLTIAAGDLPGGVRVDGEGGITGSALTKKRAVINLAISYVAGKILDDVIEEGVKGIATAAAAGTAETAARYIGLAAGTAVFLMRRGREVKLEPHTELVLTFSRPVEISR